MDGLGVCGHGRLLEGLGQRGVSVARPCNILTRRAVLKRKSALRNHLTGVGADDVYAQETVGLGVGEHLDHTLSVQVGLGSRVGAEGEGADVVRDLLVLQVLLTLADPGDLGVGVHDRGDTAVVDVAVALLDVFDGSNSLLLSLVSKHGSEGRVTDAADVRNLGAVL